jgi:methionyl-tRNA formyltransferase
MKNAVKYVFFGSTSDSVIVLDKICKSRLSANPPVLSDGLQLIAVVTQPPRPTGRKHRLIPTAVAVWANSHNIPCITFQNDPVKPWLFADEKSVEKELHRLGAGLIISACYGQKIPQSVIGNAEYGGLNIHPSLLPRWRGADPVPWSILEGDENTGVTIVTLSDKFDSGKIISQITVHLSGNELPDPLRTRLFNDGANLLVKILPDYLSGKISGTPQDITKSIYAKKLTRENGFVSWDEIVKAMSGGPGAVPLERKIRAFSPWPGVWTKIKLKDPFEKTQGRQKEKLKVNKTIDNNDKRLKILSAFLQPATNNLQLNLVQLEGKKPVPFIQFAPAYL